MDVHSYYFGKAKASHIEYHQKIYAIPLKAPETSDCIELLFFKSF